LAKPVFYELTKQPGEIVHIPGTNFVPELQSGENVTGATVTVQNRSTLADVTASMLVPGSVSFVGNIVTFDLQGGTDGNDFFIHVVVTTNQSRNYQSTHIIQVRIRPRDDTDSFLLVSVDDALQELGLSEDAYRVTERRIRALTQAFETFCHDKFKQRNEVLILDGNDQQLLDLGSHAVSVTKIVEGDNGLLNPATNIIRDPTVFPFVLHPNRGLVFSLFKWKFGVQNVQVTCRTGFAGGVPMELQEVAFSILRGRNVGFLGTFFQSEHIGEYSYTLPPLTGAMLDDWPTSIRAILLKYRRWSIA
jgi:hypothetical protein